MGAMVRDKGNRILCLVFAFMLLAVALFQSCDYLASDGASVSASFTKDISISTSAGGLDEYDTNVMVAPSGYPYADYDVNNIFFYCGNLVTLSDYGMYMRSPDVYAYKISFTPVSYSASFSANCIEMRYMVGGHGDFADLSGEYSGVIGASSGAVAEIYYVNDFKSQYLSIAPVVMCSCQHSDTSDASVAFSVNADYTIKITEYTLEDYTDVILEDILTELEAHGDLTEELNTMLEEALYANGQPIADIVSNISSALSSITYSYLKPMKVSLSNIETTLNSMYEEEQKQTTWLEKIWNSIQEFFNPSEDEQSKVDAFNSESVEQSSELDSIVNDLDKLDKPDADVIKPDIGSQLPTDDDNYIDVIFSCIYIFNSPVTMLTLVFMFGLIGYVLFGKR